VLDYTWARSDGAEVNRIIAEASRGSKYYDMQVKKDRELTEKIEWFRAKVCGLVLTGLELIF
jgi:hypothetical protein